MSVIGEAGRNPGDLGFRVVQLERQVADLLSARRLVSASVGSGGLRIHGGGRLLLEDPAADRYIRARLGRFEFGRLSDGIDSPVAFLNARNQDLSVQANFNAFLIGGNQVSLRCDNGHIFIMAEHGGLFIDGGFQGDEVLPLGGDMSVFVDGLLHLSSLGMIQLVGQDHVVLAAQDGASLFFDAEGQVQIVSGDAIFIDSATDQVLITHQVAGGSANAAWSGDLIFEVGSSRRFKTDIRDYRMSPRTVLDLKPRTWRDKVDVERDPETDRWHVGFIAEEVEAAGLGDFVDYDDEGRPKAVTYDRLCVALLEHNRYLQAQLDALTAWAKTQGYQPPAEPDVEPTSLPKRKPLARARRVDRPERGAPNARPARGRPRVR